MRSTTKAAAAFTITALLFIGAAPAFTQDETVWKHGTDAWIVGFSWDKVPGEPTVLELDGQWLHYASDRQAFGIALGLFNAGETEAFMVGPAWEFNLPQLERGHFFLLTRAELLGGDANDFAAAMLAFGAGYKLHVGDSSAVRFTVDYREAVDKADNVDPELAGQFAGRYKVGVTFEIGAGNNTQVR